RVSGAAQRSMRYGSREGSLCSFITRVTMSYSSTVMSSSRCDLGLHPGGTNTLLMRCLRSWCFPCAPQFERSHPQSHHCSSCPLLAAPWPSRLDEGSEFLELVLERGDQLLDLARLHPQRVDDDLADGLRASLQEVELVAVRL